MKALACSLRKTHTIHLYPILNNIVLKLTMAFRLGIPCLWERLELARISFDRTLSDWTHRPGSGHKNQLEQPRRHVRRDNNSYHLLSTLCATHCTCIFSPLFQDNPVRQRLSLSPSIDKETGTKRSSNLPLVMNQQIPEPGFQFRHLASILLIS